MSARRLAPRSGSRRNIEAPPIPAPISPARTVEVIVSLPLMQFYRVASAASEPWTRCAARLIEHCNRSATERPHGAERSEAQVESHDGLSIPSVQVSPDERRRRPGEVFQHRGLREYVQTLRRDRREAQVAVLVEDHQLAVGVEQ